MHVIPAGLSECLYHSLTPDLLLDTSPVMIVTAIILVDQT